MENLISPSEKELKNNKSNFTAGIHIDRLVNKETYKNFDELIKCKICFDILVNPFDCEKCGNTFCHDCAVNFIKDSKPCPLCNNKDHPETATNNQLEFTIKASSLAITSFLSSLKFYCLNKEIGCSEKISYLNVLDHDKECTFSFSKCPNIRCSKLVRRQGLEKHIRKECEYSLFRCENCNLDFNRNEYIEHIENCKVVESVFDTKQPILDQEKNDQQTSQFKYDSYTDIDLKNLSNSNFMKMLLFHFGKMNFEMDKKFSNIHSEMKSIKDEMIKFQSDNLVFIENINNEIEVLNERVSRIETGMSHTEGVRKIVEENMRETIVIRDSVLPNFGIKPNSKENSVSGSTIMSGHSSGNNSKINSEVMSMFSSKPSEKIEQKEIMGSSVNTQSSSVNYSSQKEKNNNPNNIPNVKKVDVRSLKKTIVKDGNNLNNKSPIRSPLNRSPVNTNIRSKNDISIINQNNHNHQISSGHGAAFNSSSTKTYNFETESFNMKTNNMTMIKSMIKNQEIIIDHLNKIAKKVEQNESELLKKIDKSDEEIKRFLTDDIMEEFKGYTLESSLDNSNRIIKKIEDCLKK
jgi:hypothetical protein